MCADAAGAACDDGGAAFKGEEGGERGRHYFGIGRVGVRLVVCWCGFAVVGDGGIGVFEDGGRGLSHDPALTWRGS